MIIHLLLKLLFYNYLYKSDTLMISPQRVYRLVSRLHKTRYTIRDKHAARTLQTTCKVKFHQKSK